MSRLGNLCVWAALAAGLWGIIFICSNDRGPIPTAASRPAFGPDHPSSCPLCNDPGPELPDEIDSSNVHIRST
jgi:hypothetical protein